MKTFKWLLVILCICMLPLSLGCGKKLVSSEVGPSVPIRETPRIPETKTAEKPALREEALARDKTADLEKEKKLREESIREQELREKALREEAARKEAAAREAALKSLKLEPVYFDFDQWVIREDQKEVMTKNAEWLKANPRAKVLIEGNCDERGTAEYNLALGQNRANTARGSRKTGWKQSAMASNVPWTKAIAKQLGQRIGGQILFLKDRFPSLTYFLHKNGERMSSGLLSHRYRSG